MLIWIPFHTRGVSHNLQLIVVTSGIRTHDSRTMHRMKLPHWTPCTSRGDSSISVHREYGRNIARKESGTTSVLMEVGLHRGEKRIGKHCLTDMVPRREDLLVITANSVVAHTAVAAVPHQIAVHTGA